MSLKEVIASGAPTAIGPYSQAIDTGSIVFVAGQVGRAPSTGELPEGIEAQTEQTMENIKSILESAGLTWANVARAMCLLADMNDFDAFNAVYSRYISDPKPARATYAVKQLPRGALVEIEVFAVRD